MIPPALPRLEPDPLPLPDVGRPPHHRLCPEGTPPIGLEFLGAKATTGGYLLPCPCCVQGWALLVPTGEPCSYTVSLGHGCSRGCAGPHIAWCHAWRCMDLPPEPAVVPDEKGRRYAVAAVRNEMRQLLERRPADPVRGPRPGARRPLRRRPASSWPPRGSTRTSSSPICCASPPAWAPSPGPSGRR